jgi:lysophospholipase L1-like esterase
LNKDHSPSLNQQINETNVIIKENDMFEVIDLHSIFLDSENELDLKYSHDGLHLNETGYDHWMRRIKPLIDKLNK